MWIDPRLPLPNGTYRAGRRAGLRMLVLLGLGVVLCGWLAAVLAWEGRGRTPAAAVWVFVVLGLVFLAAGVLAWRAALPRTLTVDDVGVRGRGGLTVRWDAPARVHVFPSVLIVNPGYAPVGDPGRAHIWTGLVVTDENHRVVGRLLSLDWPAALVEALALRLARGSGPETPGRPTRHEAPFPGARFLGLRRFAGSAS